MQNPERFGPLVVRLGMVVLFVWFGVQQVTDVAAWVSWVPAWITQLTGMNANTIVLLNGTFEIVGGLLLLAGVWVRWVALLLGLHLLAITFEIGYNAIGVRDFAIAIATLALSLIGSDDWTVDKKFQ